MKDEFKRNANHSNIEKYVERVTTKQLKELFLNGDDEFFFKGNLRKLGYKKVAPGIYEIFKKPILTQEE